MNILPTLTDGVGYFALGWLLLWSLVLFVLMGRDKHLAKAHDRRIPEATLFFLAFLGGGLGGCFGMQVFRHKTRHLQFIIGFPLITLLQWGLVIYLVFIAPFR